MASPTLEQELQALTKTDPPLIRASEHPTLPLTIYNYTNQAQWKRYWNSLTMMSRGLVLERAASKVVARPMAKFFNHSEGLHTSPDTDPFTVLQKVDGSLGIWFCYQGEWVMATRGSFTSPQAAEGRRLAVKAGLPAKCDPKATYCFEIVYPENHLIVDYSNRRELILLAVIDTDTGADAPNHALSAIAAAIGVQPAQSVDRASADLEALARLDLPNEEGFVIRFDTTGERLKIKFATYMQMARSGVGGSRVSAHGPSASSVKELVVDLLLRDPQDTIEDHLDSIPDEFYDDARVAQETYKRLYGEHVAEFDRAIARYRDVPFREIDTGIPGRNLIFKALKLLRGGPADANALAEARNEYVGSVAAGLMGCRPRGKKKSG